MTTRAHRPPVGAGLARPARAIGLGVDAREAHAAAAAPRAGDRARRCRRGSRSRWPVPRQGIHSRGPWAPPPRSSSCRLARSPSQARVSVARHERQEPPAPALEWAAVALITLGAAVLRLLHIGQVPPDPFYDAAVRSMGLSWHNFFFGAFEPAEPACRSTSRPSTCGCRWRA